MLDLDAALARCDHEIARCTLPTSDRAYLVTMGSNDWSTERRILLALKQIEAEAPPKAPAPTCPV